ncbi:MAG: rhomboid family intramembrane serine protease [Syntrophomonas sp.]
MIPLRDSTPSNRFPLITVIIIALNLFIFYQESSLGTEELNRLISIFGLVPANYSNFNVPILAYIPFLSSMFLHGSWTHVIGNMWILWLFGDNLEDRMGRGRFLLFYLLCGVIAAFTHYFVNPASAEPVVGASGAVAGIMGAYFLMFKKAKVLTFIPPFFLFNLPAWIYLGFWALSQLWCGAAQVFAANACGQIAFWAHIGGFLAGMILYRFFLQSESRNDYL